jgi:hypothetical protein
VRGASSDRGDLAPRRTQNRRTNSTPAAADATRSARAPLRRRRRVWHEPSLHGVDQPRVQPVTSGDEPRSRSGCLVGRRAGVRREACAVKLGCGQWRGEQLDWDSGARDASGTVLDRQPAGLRSDAEATTRTVQERHCACARAQIGSTCHRFTLWHGEQWRALPRLNRLPVGRQRKMRQRIRGRVFIRSQELFPRSVSHKYLVVDIPRAALRASAQQPSMLPNRRTVLHPYFPGVSGAIPTGHGMDGLCGGSVGVANDTNCRMTLCQAPRRTMIKGARSTTAATSVGDEPARYGTEGRRSPPVSR